MHLQFHSVSEKQRLFALTVPSVRIRELVLLAVQSVKLGALLAVQLVKFGCLELEDEEEEEAAKQFFGHVDPKRPFCRIVSYLVLAILLHAFFNRRASFTRSQSREDKTLPLLFLFLSPLFWFVWGAETLRMSVLAFPILFWSLPRARTTGGDGGVNLG